MRTSAVVAHLSLFLSFSLFPSLSLALSLSFGGFGRVSAELIAATCPSQQRGHAVAISSMLAESQRDYIGILPDFLGPVP